MAARLNPKQDERSRAAIQTTQLIKRLNCFALDVPDDAGNAVELDANRLRAIDILLKKSLPDLSSIQMTGGGEGGEHLHKVEWVVVSPKP